MNTSLSSPFADAPTTGGEPGGARVRVLMIDAVELLSAAEGWLREEFLPRLPGDALVVLAGQYPPDPAWITDAGRSELVRCLPLVSCASSSL